jgi:hypothetical protein
MPAQNFFRLNDLDRAKQTWPQSNHTNQQSWLGGQKREKSPRPLVGESETRGVTPYDLVTAHAERAHICAHGQPQRWMEFSEGTGSLNPASLDAGIYNDCLAILTRHPEAFEDTCVSDALSGLRFAPAIKIIGRTIGKIFNRLYTVFTEGDEHSRRYTWNILKSVFNAKFLSLSIKVQLNAI